MRLRYKIGVAAASLLIAGSLYAGNPQRAGSAGAPELLINPWARSTGWGSVNIAGVRGVNASYLNIAGIAQTERTDVAFTNTQWLVGSDIAINAFGFNQKVGANGVMGANVTAFDYGEWERTTTSNPDGTLGTISPTTVIIGLSYAQRFTESILGGVNIKVFNQASPELNASAVCFDAGVQYITGAEKQMKFGITLKNVGPSASYRGDGKSLSLTVPSGGFIRTFEERSADFELPTTLSIGGSYDFNFTDQRLTVAAGFMSNSFEKDRYTLGAEYALKEMAMLRLGYTLYDNSDEDRVTTVFNGISAGLSVQVPMGSSKFIVDYSFTDTDRFDGVHAIGLAFNL
jgi:hypothetical protein